MINIIGGVMPRKSDLIVECLKKMDETKEFQSLEVIDINELVNSIVRFVSKLTTTDRCMLENL